MVSRTKGALAQIVKDTRLAVGRSSSNIPIHKLEKHINFQSAPRNFAAALAGSGINIIAEIKRAVPRQINGKLKKVEIYRGEATTEELAAAYRRAGAKCLSVVTKKKWFGGSPADVSKARSATSLPILRKDFIVDPWQVFEARAIGADAILLIVAALPLASLRELESVAANLGMGVLVEVHSPRELDDACALKTRFIGVNNRNLETLGINLETTKTVAALLPKDKLLVAESGIADGEDIKKLRDYGADAFLIGRTLMQTVKPWQTLRRLMNEAKR